MSRTRATLATLLLATAAFSPTFAQSARRPMALDDLMSLRNVGSAAISPDGELVVFTISAWEHPGAQPAKGDTAKGDGHDMRSHLWLVPADGSRPARQITLVRTR